MLDAMRRGAVNWLAKVLLGLLIVAFALWGVADVFRNYGRANEEQQMLELELQRGKTQDGQVVGTVKVER